MKELKNKIVISRENCDNFLTKGKRYIVTKEVDTSYYVIDDREIVSPFFKSRFISSCDDCEIRHCNGCLMNKEI